jgi:phage terminase large subunit-like protein
MISERTLRRWRKEALHLILYDKEADLHHIGVKLSERILKMTQELLDQHLMKT